MLTSIALSCISFSGALRRRTLPTLSIYLASTVLISSMSMSTCNADSTMLEDSMYPGTAVTRMLNIRDRVKSLTPEQLNGNWDDVRRNILWAGGLRDLPNARPGEGYTGHSFNDFNHCDLTAMRGDDVHNNNEGRVSGIAYNNRLGKGIQIASLPEVGPGGSWSTCMIGSNLEPPQDVAHIQFRSRIAFKLVWVAPKFDQFVLVDDDGHLLAHGKPIGNLPNIQERYQNYMTVRGSKYASEADRLSVESSSSN